MSRIKGAMLVVGMLVVSAIGVATASAALPEFDGPFPIHFVANQLGTGTLLTAGGREVSCSGGSTLGFITSAKHVSVNSIIYTGCKSTSFGAGECRSGATKEEIKSLALLGLLGYINKVNKEVGLLFEPSGGINHFASFECETFLGKEKLVVRGTVICHLSPVNTLTKNYHLLCKQTKGVQEPLSFEGLATKDTLETEGVSGPEVFGFEQSGVTALSDILTLTLTLILA